MKKGKDFRVMSHYDCLPRKAVQSFWEINWAAYTQNELVKHTDEVKAPCRSEVNNLTKNTQWSEIVGFKF